MIYLTDDGEDLDIYQSETKHGKCLKIYFNCGWSDGSGAIVLTNNDLIKMLELLEKEE